MYTKDRDISKSYLEVRNMGHYLNPGIAKFKKSLKSKIYVDKSNLIIKMNELIDTEERFVCISRPRRFGKTMVANMLAAYYGMDEDANNLFQNLTINKHSTYVEHLNKYDVLMINMQDFLSQTNSVTEMINELQSEVASEIIERYPEVKYKKNDSLIHVMKDVYLHTKQSFIILIDEWDCLFREYKDNQESQKEYLDFLRLWLKDQAYVGLAYMTGILPIKKYGTHSALNMFEEYSMTEPSQFLNYFGFKGCEVEELASKHDVDFDEIRKWYNGYFVDLGTPIYNPKSVKSCLLRKNFSSYWSETETYEALKDYIKLDFDGLKEKITLMLAGESIKIETRSFVNDMTTFKKADDVLTLLVHLGYLSYNFEEKTVRIPNKEVKEEFQTSIEVLKWEHVVVALENADKVLKAIWNQEANVVAEKIEEVHEKNVSILKYNDENALSSVIGLALYTAIDYYTVIREIPSGKGYADIVYIPRKKHVDKPALVVELKWNKTVEGAIDQIKKKNYTSALEEYEGNLLLVGVNYDTKTKKHECVIESWQM